MEEQSKTTQATNPKSLAEAKLDNSYYALLGLHPSASAIEIRRAYRQLSKLYHPDTTDLTVPIATVKFQQLNEAYATLSNPERRLLYDYKIGYSRVNVIQPKSYINNPNSVSQDQEDWSDSAYLNPQSRPLSTGEIFALFILGVTFIGCLALAIGIGLTRGDAAFVFPHASIHYQGLQEQLISCCPLKLTSLSFYILH